MTTDQDSTSDRERDIPEQAARLAALVGGDLSPAEAEALRVELTKSGLSQALRDSEALAAFLRDETDIAPPSRSVDRVKNLITAERPGIVDRVADGLAEGVRRLVAVLDFDSRYSPALPGFRGVADAVQIAFSCDGVEIDLEISEGEAGRSGIRGQIDTEETEGWSLALECESGESTDHEVSPDGSFRASAEPGTYVLRFNREDLVVEAGPLPLP